MRKLLSANFARLWRSNFFWLTAGILCCWGGIVYFLMVLNTEKHGISDIAWNTYFFNGNLCLGPALAVFTAFFIGSEYSDGGFRNKIAVGHKRLPIYLSNLITCAGAGILFLTTYWLGIIAMGLPLMGTEILSGLDRPLLGVLFSCMAAVSYSALYCLIAMLDSSKARSVVIGLLLSAFLFFGGFATYNGLAQPEFTTYVVTNEQGQQELLENVPNSKYLSETERVVYQFLDAVLPSCQALRPIMPKGEYPAHLPLCALGWTALLTIFGAELFQRKDIK